MSACYIFIANVVLPEEDGPLIMISLISSRAEEDDPTTICFSFRCLEATDRVTGPSPKRFSP